MPEEETQPTQEQLDSAYQLGHTSNALGGGYSADEAQRSYTLAQNMATQHRGVAEALIESSGEMGAAE